MGHSRLSPVSVASWQRAYKNVGHADSLSALYVDSSVNKNTWHASVIYHFDVLIASNNTPTRNAT